MVKIVFIIIALTLSANIILTKDLIRLKWFILGIVFLPNQIILFDYGILMPMQRFLVYSLILSVIGHKQLLFYYKIFPVKYSMWFVFIAILLIGIFDSRLSVVLKIYRPVTTFLETFFVLLLSFSIRYKKKDIQALIRFILLISIPLTVYGIYNYITGDNPYDSIITSTYGFDSASEGYAIEGSRFRINSFTFHPIFYGYLCSLFIMLAIYAFFYFRKLKGLALITFPLLFSNLLLTNSRTPVIVLFIGLAVFLVLTNSLKLKIRMIFGGIAIAVILLQIPIVQEKLQRTLDVFVTGGKEVSGSSVDMRMTQLDSSLDIFIKNPLTGNGLEYINEDLGWTNNADERVVDSDLAGFESYLFQLLIEQGLAGIVSNMVLFISLFLTFKKYSVVSRVSSLGISLLMMFATYILITGTLGSWLITFSLLGFVMANNEELNRLNKIKKKCDAVRIQYRNTGI